MENLTVSKKNVLYYLGLQFKTLVILLQETHCSNAEKLVVPSFQLARSSLSRKHGIAMFVHKRLTYTLLDQPPPTSKIEWLCVDADGYKIVNIYKPPPTQLWSLDLLVFPYPVSMLAISTVATLIVVTTIILRTVSTWLAGLVLIVLHFFTMPRISGSWNTGDYPDLAFASVVPNSRLPDRRVYEKFPGHNFDLCLFHP